jgi:hypothetical protein
MLPPQSFPRRFAGSLFTIAHFLKECGGSWCNGIFLQLAKPTQNPRGAGRECKRDFSPTTGALFEQRATIPSCPISAIRKQVATGSSILRGRLLQYSLSGGCCDSMCCSARRHARDNEISRYSGELCILSWDNRRHIQLLKLTNHLISRARICGEKS